jgi:hypothetical protein
MVPFDLADFAVMATRELPFLPLFRFFVDGGGPEAVRDTASRWVIAVGDRGTEVPAHRWGAD